MLIDYDYEQDNETDTVDNSSRDSVGCAGKCDHDEQVIYNMPDDVYQALKKELGNPSDGQLVDEYIRNRAHWDSIGNSFEY